MDSKLEGIKSQMRERNITKAVISLSGGMDSTVLAYLLANALGKSQVTCLSFDYSQRHSVELEMAKLTTARLGVSHKIIDISFLGDIVKDVSAMVKGEVVTPMADDLEAGKVVPTYVPFRNSILSSITLSYAESVGADTVALGVQFGDYAQSDNYFYWDCSLAFTQKFQELADLNDKHKIQYYTPFVEMTKAQEILIGKELGVHFDETWTCYGPIQEVSWKIVPEPAGGRNKVESVKHIPCGVCPSCVGRANAFSEVGLTDPLVSYSKD